MNSRTDRTPQNREKPWKRLLEAAQLVNATNAVVRGVRWATTEGRDLLLALVHLLG